MAADPQRRAALERLRNLQTRFADLSSLQFDSNVSLGNVLVVGGSNASGFGMSLARGILRAHPENRVVITGRPSSSKKKLDPLRQQIESGNAPLDHQRTEVYELDVTDPTGSQLVNRRFEHIVVAAANMDLKYLKRNIPYSQVPDEAKVSARSVVVDGFYNIAEFIALPKTSMYGVSFAGHDFPGYNIGPVKKELEDTILNGSRTDLIKRQNVLSLGVFDSVAGLGIEGFDDAAKIYEAMGLTDPTMSEMVYGSIMAMADQSLDRQIIDLDGGLRKALATDEGRAKYQRFIESLVPSAA